MPKRLLTFDDLYSFYSNQDKSMVFDSSADGEIVIQVPGQLHFEEDEKNEGLLPVTLRACHTSQNRNKSNIDKKVMDKALPSFSNRPILGYIHEVDGEPQFAGHEFYEDKNGELVYVEYPVGVIPESCDARMEYNKEKDRYDVYVNGYIFEQYNKAAEILERESELSVSVELNVNKLSYDAKEKILNIEDFYFSGVTILGCDEEGNEIKPGMEGASIQIADFSAKNNSLINFNQNDLIAEMQKLTNAINALNIEKISKKGGCEVTFEELLEKYGKTEADIEFECVDLSAEELEAKFEEVFGEAAKPESDPTFDEDPEGGEPEENNEEPDEAEEPDEESEDECAESEDKEEFSISYSVNVPNKEVKTFEVSLNDIQHALYTLVNDTYAEADDTYYEVIVYSDHVVMLDYWHGKNYRQSYKCRKDVYSLVGDRVPVYAQWLTQDEIDQLDNLKKNYSLIETELNQYKENEESAKKDTLFSSEEYYCISDKEEFAALKEDHSEMTFEELNSKLDEVLLKYAKSGNLKFSKDEPETQTKKTLLSVPKAVKKSRYGNLFSKRV